MTSTLSETASHVRTAIERATAASTGFALRAPRCALSLLLVTTLLLGAGMTRLHVEADAEDMLRPDDPTRLAYDRFREDFGREDAVVIAIERAGSVFEPVFAERLRALHEDLESSVPHLAEVQSLVNVRETQATPDALIVAPLFESLPDDASGWAALAERALGNPAYVDRLVSANGRFTALVVTPSATTELAHDDLLEGFEERESGGALPSMTRAESRTFVAAIRDVVEAHRAPGFDPMLAGGPLSGEALQGGMERDLSRFLTLAIGIIAALLFALFRRITSVLIPLGVVAASLVSTIGAMGWLGIAMSVGTQILPSFLLAVGVGYTIHVLTLFDHVLVRQSPGRAGRLRAAAQAAQQTGFALAMTALTTAAGLAAFATSSLVPVAELGMMAPAGVLLCLVFTLMGVPALLVLAPIAPAPRRERGDGFAVRLLTTVGAWSAAHARGVLVSTALLGAIALAGTLQLRFSYDPIAWLPADDPIRTASAAIDEHLGGTLPIELVITSEHEAGARDPHLLRALDDFAAELVDQPTGAVRVGQTSSLADIVKEVHSSLEPERASQEPIPGNPQLVAQELLLFESGGAEDLARVVAEGWRKTRMSILVEHVDSIHLPGFVVDAKARLEARLGEGYRVEATGLVVLLSTSIRALIEDMSRSYLLAFALVVPLMIFVLGSVREGLTSVIPNFVPILLALGFMGFAGIAIDMLGVLVGSIALGLVVDDTIHFFHAARCARDAGLSTEAAVQRTLRTTGRALLSTSLALGAGFLVFTLAGLSTLHRFGGVMVFAIAAAFLCDIVLGPALLAHREARRAARSAVLPGPVATPATAGG